MNAPDTLSRLKHNEISRLREQRDNARDALDALLVELEWHGPHPESLAQMIERARRIHALTGPFAG